MSLSDPLFVALLNKLPPAGSTWPLSDRLVWLQAADAVITLLYGSPERIEISIAASAVQGAVRKELASVTVAPPEPPKVDPPKRPSKPQVRPDRMAPAPRVGARRPEGIPTTFTMIQTVLKEVDAFTLTARDVMAKIEARWWPGLGPTFLNPDISSFIGMYRLTRNADGKLALTEKGASMISEDLRHRNKVEFQEPKPTVPEAIKEIVEEVQEPPQHLPNPKIAMEPKVERSHILPTTLVKAPMPPVKPTMGPRPSVHHPAAPQPVKFDHGELTTYLPNMRAYVLAGKLRVAMGKGHISEAFLAENTIGSNTEANRMLVKDLCLGMNDDLAAVRLKVEYYPGFGLLMKEVV